MKQFNSLHEAVVFCKKNMKMFDDAKEARKFGENIVVKQGIEFQSLTMFEGKLHIACSFRDEDTEEVSTILWNLVEKITYHSDGIFCFR